MNVLILGIGNILLHDEGVGVRAIEELERCFSFPAEVELVDGGTCGLELRDIMCGRDLLLLIDAMRNGGVPGTPYRLEGDEVPAHFHTRISPHQLGISDLLATLSLTGSLPARMVLFGVEPGDLSTGLGLSPAVEAGLEKVVTAVGEELSGHGLQPGVPSFEEARIPGFWSTRQSPPAGEKEATP
jgi:hydrogenase maturation protease